MSIHNVRTVAPCYWELLALLVIPTWLLHWFPRFEPALVPCSLAWNLPLSARYLRYVAAPLLVPARGSSLDGCLTGLVTLTFTHMYGYLLYIHTCDGELLALLVIPTWLLHWFPRFEPALVQRFLAWNIPLSARYLRYVAAPLLVPPRGSSLDGCLTGSDWPCPFPYFHPYVWHLCLQTHSR